MRQFRSSFSYYIFIGVAVWTACLALSSPLWAASAIVSPSAGYQATDHLEDVDLTGLDIRGDLVAGYVNSNLTVYDRNTWQPLYNLGDAGYAPSTTTYLSFATFDPSGDSLWVGYTVGGNNNDQIFEVTDFRTAPVWNYRATFASNYDLAFSGATPYISGPNSQIYGADNGIWRLDGASPTLIANVGGLAASIAFDAAGNLYYGTNFGVNDRLLRFSAQQVAEGNKTLADAEILTSMAFPGADVAVDAAGHVLFTFNQSDAYWSPLSCTLAMWDGTSGIGENYVVIGENGPGHSYPNVNAIGDVTTDGTIYLNDAGAWGIPVLGLAEITRVPEPSTAMLVTMALLAALCCRRRTRR